MSNIRLIPLPTADGNGVALTIFVDDTVKAVTIPWGTPFTINLMMVNTETGEPLETTRGYIREGDRL